MDNDKKLELFKQQKETLDTFLKTGAITKAQYDFSYNGLKTKMGITNEDLEALKNK